jgi:hypothetical protein
MNIEALEVERRRRERFKALADAEIGRIRAGDASAGAQKTEDGRSKADHVEPEASESR